MSTKKYNHFEYGEAVASKLKPIQGRFYKATEQTNLLDLENKISEARDTILIAIDGTESDFSWPMSDSLIEEPQYLFLILQQTDSDDFSTVIEAQKYCRTLAKEIISKMLQDAANYLHGLQFIEGGNFHVEGIGPVGDNFYGVSLEISFKQGIGYHINKDLWEE